MKVGDLVKYTERSCWGFAAESSYDIMEHQKKIVGFGIVIAADNALHSSNPETVVVWWPKFGEAWEPVDRLEVISESR